MGIPNTFTSLLREMMQSSLFESTTTGFPMSGVIEDRLAGAEEVAAVDKGQETRMN
jgi:hypothetical protein